MTTSWPRLRARTENAWGYIPGQSCAHYFNRWYLLGPRPGDEHFLRRFEVESACSRVREDSGDVYLADYDVRRCSHCLRTLRAHEPQVPDIVDGPVWAWATGSTRIHRWQFQKVGVGHWISRCGVWRRASEINSPSDEELADDSLKCKKCIKYIGDEESE